MSLRIPARWFQLEERQFYDYSKMRTGGTEELCIDNSSGSLHGIFTVHWKFTVKSRVVWSNQQYKNRVFTLEKKIDRKGGVTYWFVPIEPGKGNTDYPAYVLDEVLLPNITPVRKLQWEVARGIRSALRIAATIWVASGLSWPMVSAETCQKVRDIVSRVVPAWNIGEPIRAIPVSLEGQWEIVADNSGENPVDSWGSSQSHVEESSASQESDVSAVSVENEPAQISVPIVSGESETPIPDFHTVQSWDTLNKICAQYGVRLESLLKINSLTEKSILRVWDIIRLKEWTHSSQSEWPDSLQNKISIIDTYIAERTSGSKIRCQINWSMIMSSATKYAVPPEFLIAILVNDSNLGTEWKWATNNNPGNVGQTDELDKKWITVSWYETINDWVDACAANLARRIQAFKHRYPWTEPSAKALVTNVGPDGCWFFKYKIGEPNPNKQWAYMTSSHWQKNVPKLAAFLGKQIL